MSWVGRMHERFASVRVHGGTCFPGHLRRPPVDELPVPPTHFEVGLEVCALTIADGSDFTRKRDGGALRDARLLILEAFTATKSSTLDF